MTILSVFFPLFLFYLGDTSDPSPSSSATTRESLSNNKFDPLFSNIFLKLDWWTLIDVPIVLVKSSLFSEQLSVDLCSLIIFYYRIDWFWNCCVFDMNSFIVYYYFSCEFFILCKTLLDCWANSRTGYNDYVKGDLMFFAIPLLKVELLSQ